MTHYPDHPSAITGLSSILLSTYEQSLTPGPSVLSTSHHDASAAESTHLAALAARERAYFLLSSLAKTGEGWDDSEAWSLLAKAHELAGQDERAREALWFVVNLEDGRAVRGWEVVRNGF